MRLSQLFTKTLREAPADELAINAQFLIRGGFVFKNSAGIYSYLPLGWRVLNKITNIVREEMNAIGGQELLMPTLIEKKYMEPTGRWDLDVGYFSQPKIKLPPNPPEALLREPDFVLGWSHEEVLTTIASKFINSYKDLPFSAYQIQTKFRHEVRAKSGLLRGREFMMKDLYSFHANEKDLEIYYEKVKEGFVASEFVGSGILRYMTIFHHGGKRGVGGPCFPKDLAAFIEFCKTIGVDAELPKATRRANLKILKRQGLTEKLAEETF